MIEEDRFWQRWIELWLNFEGHDRPTPAIAAAIQNGGGLTGGGGVNFRFLSEANNKNLPKEDKNER